jgi:hypothetical protein
MKERRQEVFVVSSNCILVITLTLMKSLLLLFLLLKFRTIYLLQLLVTVHPNRWLHVHHGTVQYERTAKKQMEGGEGEPAVYSTLLYSTPPTPA